MRLSEMENAAGMTIRRDGDFQTLGFLCDTYPHQLVFLENRAFLRGLQRNRSVSAVLTTAELADAVPRGVAVAICDQPRTVFANLHNELALRGFYWDDFPTVIDPSAKVHPTAWIAERNVRIGAASEIAPNATVLERCVIRENVVVGSGCVLGGGGFQTVRLAGAMVVMNHARGHLVVTPVPILPGAGLAAGLLLHNTLIPP